MSAGGSQPASIRMQLIGARQTIANLNATGAAVGRLTRQVNLSDAAMEHANRRSFLFNQAMFTLRRFAYAGTLALVGLAGAAERLGFSFNMTMENNTVAMNHFLGSQRATTKEMNYLFELAAKTPFEFPQLTSATRRFLAFGYTLGETNKYLSIIGDTVAGMGGSADDIEHLVLVFGQIRASGRLLGQDMLQLEQRGIPAVEILQKQLGLTAAQTARIGDLAIPSSVAIPALMRGMAETFGGSAREQAKTLQGQLSTMHDYASRLMGTLTMPLYERFRDHIIPQFNKIFTILDRMNRRNGSISITDIVTVTDQQLGLQGRAIHAWQLLSLYAGAFARIMRRSILPVVIEVSHVFFAALYPILLLTGQVLALLSRHTTILRIVLTPLIALYVAERIALMLAYTWRLRTIFLLALERRQAFLNMTVWRLVVLWKYREVIAARAVYITSRLVTLAMIRELAVVRGLSGFWTVLTKGYIRGANGQFVAMTLLQRGALRLRYAFYAARGGIIALVAGLRALTISMVTFLLTNPVGWAILLIGALAILYWRWGRFRDVVNSTISWLWRHPLVALFIPVIGPLVVMIKAFMHIKSLLQDIGRLARHAFSAITHPGGSLSAISSVLGPFGPGVQLGGFIARHIPGLAGGGTVHSGGMALVGERGPELVQMPAAARVIPLPAAGDHVLPNITVPITIEVDGKVLAEVVARHRQDRQARR